MPNCRCNDRGGFTLLEIIATLVIISVLAAIAVPRYLTLDESTRQKAIDAGIGELNGRETLTWANIKISEDGYQGDPLLFPLVDTHLGGDYSWDASRPPKADGGTLIFQQETSVTLDRNASTSVTPGTWSR
jgi:prepilin-type N-terminal cleavage/methylation domain-containing protein